MMELKLNESTLGNEELKTITDLFTRGTLTMGQECLNFEQSFAEYVGSKHAVMVNSGSSANLLAFFVAANPLVDDCHILPRIEPNSEIIVPALTWSTSVWPIIQIGCIPVFIDSDPYTLQMNLDELEAAITPRTRAICAPHIMGNAIDLLRLKEIAHKYNLWLIEDTCEALGIKNNNSYLGTVGHFGTYSFYFSHHITSIEGGMIVTNDQKLADLLRCMRAHGWIRQMDDAHNIAKQYPDIDPRFLFISTGFNLRPTEINAAIGRIQLQKLASFNERRNQITQTWNNTFKTLSEKGLIRPMQITPHTDAAPFGYPVICQSRQLRQRLQQHLEDNHIETRPVICGNLARQPALKHHPYKVASTLKGADQVMDCGLYWGLHPLMSDQQISYLINTVKEFFNE